MEKNLLEELNPHTPITTCGMAGQMQKELADAWRHGAATGLLKTTRYFNMQRKKDKREWAVDVMDNVFGTRDWWVGMVTHDGSYPGGN